MNNDINKQLFVSKIAINRARYNLMFIILLTVINIACIIGKGDTLIPFSCSISTYAVAFGVSNSIIFLGITISALNLIPLLVCYFLSKNNVLFIVAPVGILVVDTLALIIISVVSGAVVSASFLIDLAFHIVSVYYLIKAVKAYKVLGNINSISTDTTTISDSVDN